MMATPPPQRPAWRAGHVRAAEALTKAFKDNPDVGDVIHSDALHFTNKLFRDFYSKLYARLVQTAPDFLGWWYKQSDEPWKTDGMRLMLDRLNTGPLVKFIRKFDPHITVCTHFMPAGIISDLIAKNRLDAEDREHASPNRGAERDGHVERAHVDAAPVERQPDEGADAGRGQQAADDQAAFEVEDFERLGRERLHGQ